jgi:hypothetical protein
MNVTSGGSARLCTWKFATVQAFRVGFSARLAGWCAPSLFIFARAAQSSPFKRVVISGAKVLA